jgi:YesN/AraC family two-component response regulator
MNPTQKTSRFPYYEEINDFLTSVTSLRTKNPYFFCLRLKGRVDQIKYKPPFKKGFYSVFLITNASKYKIYSDNNEIKTYNSFLALQSPGQIMSYSYKVGMHTKGYLLFFKSEIFSFLKKNFSQEFSFFDVLHADSFEVSDSKMAELEACFEDVFTAYEDNKDLAQKTAPLKLLILMHTINTFTQSHEKESEDKIAQGRGAEVLFQKFLQLVNNYYLEKRTVKEYANELSVSPNYLSILIKQHSNRSALSFINYRMISEAKSFITHSNSTISEISKRLNFSDTSNFVKFFKKQTGLTPIEFKKISKKEEI